MIDHEGINPPTRGIRVLVAGKYSLFNQAIGTLLSRLPGIQLAGQAMSLRELQNQSSIIQADLVLLTLPHPIDIESLVDLQRQHPRLIVLLLSLEWTPVQVQTVLKAGAVGCLAGEVTVEELGSAIRQAARGEIALSSDLQRALIISLARGQPSPKAPFESLSPREQEVLTLVCQGLSNKQIAQRLYLSVRTVENHLASVYNKLGVHTRTEAAVLALQQGGISPD